MYNKEAGATGDTAGADKIAEQAAEIKRLKAMIVTEEIRAALAAAGVSAEKAGKAVRLIDTADVLDEESGEIIPEALKAEVEALLAEFPEFRTESAASRTEKNRIKFGSDGLQKTAVNEKIASIFGNKR